MVRMVGTADVHLWPSPQLRAAVAAFAAGPLCVAWQITRPSASHSAVLRCFIRLDAAFSSSDCFRTWSFTHCSRNGLKPLYDRRCNFNEGGGPATSFLRRSSSPRPACMNFMPRTSLDNDAGDAAGAGDSAAEPPEALRSPPPRLFARPRGVAASSSPSASAAPRPFFPQRRPPGAGAAAS
eukprot:CAMPEP_0176249388 /NCGR_PEP_ID=MMETSP0121_2-20121125/33952_1 /TAXON_ID=160619 /ORGANISM="Kryptoperidinium foliaceum, Strain CCMP 1326" /LENGTH=180 /DNA_ID=CAMNT_0017589087 /DNA_START=23 /DNA_END=562 /DNA_ORIENTATION=+